MKQPGSTSPLFRAPEHTSTMPFSPGDSLPPFALLNPLARFDVVEILGRDRILLALRPSTSWLASAVAREPELADYRLQVLGVSPQVLAEAPTSTWVHVGTVDSALDFGSARAILVGLDKRVKKIYDAEPALDEIFALIDTMPMRQSEVRGRE